VADAVQGYPRWQGELARSPRLFTIMAEELKKIYRDRWAGYVMAGALVLAALSFAAQSALGRSRLDQLLSSLNFIEWGALAIAALAAGPALLDDKRHGALELYLSRAVRPWEYFVGKGLAVWVACAVIVFAPAFLYYLSSVITVEDLPEGWGWVWLGLLGHALIWATVITGLGLGLSAVLRSGRAASLILFGVVFGLDVVLSNLLEGISRDPRFQLLSPIGNLQQQNGWLFPGMDAPYAFPWWWSLLVLAGLAAVGWGVAWWRRPRLRGVE